jgi:transcriptional regulator with XRE-family HTH domain
MKDELSVEVKRFRSLRLEKGHSQRSFAELLDIGNTTADIERGKTKISGEVVMQLNRLFGVNPSWLYGMSDQKYLQESKKELIPKMITIDPVGNENVLLVNKKAAAGYADNIQDVEWYEQLPAFSIPLPEFRNASFRGFQVDGYSMTPTLQPGDWVIARAIQGLDEIKNYDICVIVLNDIVLVKQVEKPPVPDMIVAHSISPDYPPQDLDLDDIQELWLVNALLTDNITPPGQTNSTLDNIESQLSTIHRDVTQLKDMIKVKN